VRHGQWRGMVGAATVIVGLTGLMVQARPVIHAATAALGYLLVVVLSAALVGQRAGLLSGLLGSLAFTIWFIPPYGTIGIVSLEHGLRLATFLGVAAVVQRLAERARRQAEAAGQRAAELGALYQLSQSLEAEVERQRIVAIVATTVLRVSHSSGCVVVALDDAGAELARASAGTPGGAAARRFTFQRDGGRCLGWMDVTPQASGHSHDVAASPLLATIATQVGLVLERVRLSDLSSHARALAESDRLKSTLLSMVSHDMRTPLAVIKGSVTSLLDPAPAWPADVQREMLQTVREETDRLDRIVGELLEMSRIEAGAISTARRWYDLDELIVAVAEAMRPRLTPHPLVIDVPADLPWLQISYAQIEQVLRNLLENAAHYTPASAPIEVWARAGDGVLRLEVRDRGPGVPLELRERIFDKFVRAAAAERRAEGAGLGLAICRGLVEAHGGRIWVEARPGGGATFVVTLPLPATPPPVL